MRYYKPIVLGLFVAATVLVKVIPAIPTKETRPALANATTVDLSKYATAKLTDSINSPPGFPVNDLNGLSAGKQTFAGVPFEIAGIVEVLGRQLQQWGHTELPTAIKDIKINKSFQRLFLLHGVGGNGDPDGTPIARLVLHYADNRTRIIEIKYSEHVRDWWGDPYEPGSSKGSVVAWTGKNAATKQYGNGKYLRLYRSTFINPRPEVLVSSVDYVSTMPNSSSFMLGMTVD